MHKVFACSLAYWKINSDYYLEIQECVEGKTNRQLNQMENER